MKKKILIFLSLLISAPLALRLAASTLLLNLTRTELPEWKLLNECE
jgi:hypothetical protein